MCLRSAKRISNLNKSSIITNLKIDDLKVGIEGMEIFIKKFTKS
jgi:hypothetical protein